MITLILLFRSVFARTETDQSFANRTEPTEQPKTFDEPVIENLDWSTAFPKLSSENYDEDSPVAVNENTEPPSLCQGEKVSLRNMAAVIKWFDGKPAA